MFLGWNAICKESKVLMNVFIVISVAMLGGWGGLFASATFRQTFKTWPFFTSISTASFIFALTCTILGAICLTNFNKGLKNFREFFSHFSNKSGMLSFASSQC